MATTIASVLLIPSGAEATFPGANGRLAFTTYVDGTAWVATANRDGAGTQLLIRGERPGWSPDGKRIAYDTRQDDGNPTGCSPCNFEIHVMDADGSNDIRLTNHPAWDMHPAWSPDGTKIAFESRRASPDTDIYSMNADGTDVTRLTFGPPDPEFGYMRTQPAWSPDGRRITFSSGDVYAMDPDGSNVVDVTNTNRDDFLRHEESNWSPEGTMLVVDRDGCYDDECWSHYSVLRDAFTMKSDGTSRQDLGGVNWQPIWSPDGTKVLLMHGSDCAYNNGLYQCTFTLTTMNPDGSGKTSLGVGGWDPDWQPIPQSYVRPKGATPLRASLVPAFNQCTSPNETHGAPLSFSSCRPPVQTSPNLTLGTPDANGGLANSTGYVRLDAVAGDVKLASSITDVRCAYTSTAPFCTAANMTEAADYSGELQARLSVRITDRKNSPNPGGPGPGTVQDTTIPFTVPCTTTAPSTSIGSTCAVSTTVDALIPGAVTAGMRTISQLDKVDVYDGGSDGVASTAPNALFETQGVFVP